MNDLQLLPVDGAHALTADFSDVISAGAALTSCAWSSTPSLTLDSQSDNFASHRSTIKASGAQHGVRYLLQAKGTANNGEVFAKDIAVLGFNG